MPVTPTTLCAENEAGRCTSAVFALRDFRGDRFGGAPEQVHGRRAEEPEVLGAEGAVAREVPVERKRNGKALGRPFQRGEPLEVKTVKIDKKELFRVGEVFEEQGVSPVAAGVAGKERLAGRHAARSHGAAAFDDRFLRAAAVVEHDLR
jgi:hypothetical protein